MIFCPNAVIIIILFDIKINIRDKAPYHIKYLLTLIYFGFDFYILDKRFWTIKRGILQEFSTMSRVGRPCSQTFGRLRSIKAFGRRWSNSVDSSREINICRFFDPTNKPSVNFRFFVNSYFLFVTRIESIMDSQVMFIQHCLRFILSTDFSLSLFDNVRVNTGNDFRIFPKQFLSDVIRKSVGKLDLFLLGWTGWFQTSTLRPSIGGRWTARRVRSLSSRGRGSWTGV